jgi:hypothetical protein
VTNDHIRRGPLHVATRIDVASRIEAIMRRSEFQNARWGMQFYLPNTNELIYSLNSDQLFQAASAVKVFVEGSAFDALGSDNLFRTQVYRTGPVVNGILKGDLVLVAGGDVLLGGAYNPTVRWLFPSRIIHTTCSQAQSRSQMIPCGRFARLRAKSHCVASGGSKAVSWWTPRCSATYRTKGWEAPAK